MPQGPFSRRLRPPINWNMDTLLNRREALLRRELRRGWIVLVVGLLIPFLLLWSAYIGYQARRDVPREAWPMLVIALTAFVARFALYFG